MYLSLLCYRCTPCNSTTIVTLKFTIDDLPLNSWCVMLSDFHGHYWIWHHVFLWLKNLPKNDATYYSWWYRKNIIRVAVFLVSWYQLAMIDKEDREDTKNSTCFYGKKNPEHLLVMMIWWQNIIRIWPYFFEKWIPVAKSTLPMSSFLYIYCNGCHSNIYVWKLELMETQFITLQINSDKPKLTKPLSAA